MVYSRRILKFEEIRAVDIDQVGGKNASLGEMTSELSSLGVDVPPGFAITVQAFREFLTQGDLASFIFSELDGLNVNDIQTLQKTSQKVRDRILNTPFSEELKKEIATAYAALGAPGQGDVPVAVRSSATAEDLPDASFAGQQETYLNIRGLASVLEAVKHVFASLYTDRAISYREHHGFLHHEVGLSVGIQYMVRSDIGASGVLFTVDTESGFSEVMLVNASYGLGELIVQGAVDPDEYYVSKLALSLGKQAVVRKNLGSKLHKMIYADAVEGIHQITKVPVLDSEQRRFALSDPQIMALAKKAQIIEKHYGHPMDVEWGLDGQTQKLWILQARPETVASRRSKRVLERYHLEKQGELLVEGRSVGQKAAQGKVVCLKDRSDMFRLQEGDVLVTDMTDPDWEPIMKKASAIVTNRGGRTCHAAIIARELGIPAVVGCHTATQVLQDGDEVTVACNEGETGKVYRGLLGIEKKIINLKEMPPLSLNMMMNVGNPDRAFDFQNLPNEGVGLARLEFIINHMIGIHPQALLQLNTLPPALQAEILERTAAYPGPVDFYMRKLTEGISTLACAFYPKPVIVRLSDFKSNEYSNLLGGTLFEPKEENPMLGFRGASRYLDKNFQAAFALECQAIRWVREEMGLDNVAIMIPFVRTLKEAKGAIDLLAEHGLERGKDGLKLIMMCEIPSNAILAEEFLKYFDGFSIGSNDLTQLTLGLDRDSAMISHLFDERDPAIKFLLSRAIQAARQEGKYIGICGQGPSDHPDFAKWLMEQGISSLSLNPDSILETWLYLAEG